MSASSGRPSGRNGGSDDEESPSEHDDNFIGEDSLGNLQAALRQAALVDGDDGANDDNEIEEDAISLLPPYVVKRVEKLKELNDQREEILVDYLAERAALEQKFQELFKPLYKMRAEVIRGDLDSAIAEEAASGDDSNAEPHEDTQAEKVGGIPQFWVVAMGNMEVTADLITEEDVDCLEHLRDVTCVDDEDGKGFTLHFHFAPNDYFEDRILTKRYEVPNLLLSDEPILENVTGCKIMWKPGKSLTYKEVKKKQRGKGRNAGQIRTVSKKERKESFFHFFDTPKMPSMETMNEDEATQLEELFDHDYDVAQAFRSHIIPKAVTWFTGQVCVI
jgi:nucleosome assembly protein 1-like 1